jgi:hypothetical protein
MVVAKDTKAMIRGRDLGNKKDRAERGLLGSFPAPTVSGENYFGGAVAAGLGAAGFGAAGRGAAPAAVGAGTPDCVL